MGLHTKEAMQSEPQIVFHGIGASPAATDAIRGRLRKSEKVFDRITALRVVLAKSSSRGHEGFSTRRRSTPR